MRWLADENIPGHAIAFMRHRGEDVVAISEVAPGIRDEDVVARAREERRMLLSFDRDHGDLIFNRGVAPPPVIVYFRLDPPDPQTIENILAGLIALGSVALAGKFIVISANGMRQRALPASA